MPLVATELPTACRHFPIVFTDGDQPTPVAVLGVRGQENLFVDAQGQWRAGAYIPAYVRRYPFIFMENEDRSQFTLCVDEKAASVVEGRDNPFFDEAGEPTDLARSALEFCRDYQNQHAYTMEFARALAEADLLVENRADITPARRPAPGHVRLQSDRRSRSTSCRTRNSCAGAPMAGCRWCIATCCRSTPGRR